MRDGVATSLTRHLDEEVELRAREGRIDIGRKEGGREEGRRGRSPPFEACRARSREKKVSIYSPGVASEEGLITTHKREVGSDSR